MPIRKTINRLFLICIIVCNTSAWAQPEQNLKKYWRYRERFKNYVVPGECQGCGLPSTGRFPELDVNGSIIKSGHLNYPDETIHLGHYIGMLAMELHLTGGGVNLDIWYALEAFNRLDKTAEGWWRHYYLDQSSIPTDNDLNGFFIRDDVPQDFVNQMYYNDNSNIDHLVENDLNSSYFPSNDGRIAEVVGSSFTNAVYETGYGFNSPCAYFNGAGVGPREESLDQVTQLMVGLALAAKFIPSGLHALDHNGLKKHFADNETDILQEVKNIAGRITGWIHDHNWTIQNPVTGSCAKAVWWPSETGISDPCKCIAGGSEFQLFSYGLAMVNSAIQVPNMTNADQVNTYFNYNYTDGIIATSSNIWATTLFNYSMGKEDYKVLSLAAAAHIWGNSTGSMLVNRCAHEFTEGQIPGDRLHLPLLHQALYPDPNTLSYSSAFYECMLDHAECYGPQGNDDNQIWSGNQGLLVYGYADGNNPVLEFNGLSYMFYFNLYNLVYPNYLPYHHYIPPFDLCEEDIVKTGFIPTNSNTPFIESDQKTFIASNSITAQGGGDPNNPVPYIIDNDDDPQSMPYSQANVTFMAKNLVHLLPGFEAHEGVEFHATINTSLNGMDCTTSNQASVSDCSYLIPQELRSMTTSNTNPQQTIQTIAEVFEKQKSNIATIQKESDADYAIVPNPNNGVFSIISTNTSDQQANKIIIYDAMGNIIKKTETMNEAIPIDISTQAKGLYFVKIENEQGIKIEKIIYQK